MATGEHKIFSFSCQYHSAFFDKKMPELRDFFAKCCRAQQKVNFTQLIILSF